MLITRVEELTKGKRRVWLENQPPFVLYRGELRQLELAEGGEVSAEQYQEILEEILVPRARKRAMHLLEQMDRTEAQLREKLAQGEYPEAAVEAAVAYVKGFHYIDDFRYACSYIRYRCDSRSSRQLRMELARKGVPRHLIEEAMEAEYGCEDEGEKILRWMEKKHYDAQGAQQKERQRMYQFLMRKGFRTEDIMRYLT